MKCIWNAWMIRLPVYMGGYHKPWWTPFPSRLVAISQVVATATVAFLALVANTQVMLGFKKGRPKVIPRGWTHYHQQPWKWENRAPKNWQVNQVLWWCRISPIFLGLFQGIMANLVPRFILGMFCKNWFWMASNWKLFLFRAPCRQDAQC